MLRRLFTEIQLQLKLLMRDKVFVPFLALIVIISFFSAFISEVTHEDMALVYMDFSTLGIHIVCALMACFWGSQSLNTTTFSFRHLEFELVNPIRPSFLVFARYLCLLFLFALGIVIGAATTYVGAFLFGIADFTVMHLIPFVGVFCVIAVTLAASVSFSSFLGRSVAFFVSLSFWVIGQSVDAIYRLTKNGSESVSPLIKQFVYLLSRLFDLNIFLEFFSFTQYQNPEILYRSYSWIAIYMVCMSIFFLSLSGLVMESKKDY